MTNGSWNPDSYFRRWLKTIDPKWRFKAGTVEEWQDWREGLAGRFEDALGGFPNDRAGLAPVLLEQTDCGEYVRTRVELTTYEGLRMPVYVLIPKGRSGGAPAVICCHGHGYGSREAIGLNPDGTEREEPGYHNRFPVELAKRGFVAVVPELLGFGDRKLAEDGKANNSCQRISAFLLMMGQTMGGHRIYETLRCVDYVSGLEHVDPERIGIMGISGGGLVAGFAAALDERIKAAVVSGYVNTFETSILSIPHCIDNYVPGLSLLADMPDLLGLIAPRPLLVEAGKEDRIFPAAGVEEAYSVLETIYKVCGTPDRLALDHFAGGHEISGDRAYPWLEQWLSAR